MSECVFCVYQSACKYNHAPVHESETSLALPSSICHSQVSSLMIQKEILPNKKISPSSFCFAIRGCSKLRLYFLCLYIESKREIDTEQIIVNL